jgi:hypothetical protein
MKSPYLIWHAGPRPDGLGLSPLWSAAVRAHNGQRTRQSVGRIDPLRFTTHRFFLNQAMEAYDTFAHAGDTGALNVLLQRPV